ncbi:MAG: aminotransferase [Saprospiraceae bacterium]|nr:MAG: aminotransferase [Saprospiraceae bacterium]
MLSIQSKLPQTGTTIFTVMSALANECGAINLSQGFPNFPSSSRLTELVAQYMREGYNQYAPMPGVPELRAQIAAKIHHLYQIEVDPDQEITVTAGATQALFTAIAAFVSAGDEVIIVEPAYDSYGPSIEVMGAQVVPYQLGAPDYQIDWEAFAKLITPSTRMIIINTPHNPTGSILEAEDLQKLDQLTRDTEILVLSDEVYEHLIYDKEQHQSILRYPALRSRSLAVYSFGKTFHNTGWKIGYCVAPPELMKEFRKVHQFNVFSVNTPMQYALAKFMESPEEYLSLSTFFQEKRDFFLAEMKGSSLRPLACRGTYFHLFDYSAISELPEHEFAIWMTKNIGVAAIPVSAFYHQQKSDRVIRLCFAKTNDTLEQAAVLLQKL